MTILRRNPDRHSCRIRHGHDDLIDDVRQLDRRTCEPRNFNGAIFVSNPLPRKQRAAEHVVINVKIVNSGRSDIGTSS